MLRACALVVVELTISSFFCFLFYSPPPPSLQVPNAVLTVFYGFSPSFLKYGRSTIPNFQAWHKSMLDLLRQEGVFYNLLCNC